MPYLFAIVLLIAPLYVWRFSIGGLPTNFLMVANFVAIAIGLVVLLMEYKSSGKEVLNRFKTSLTGIGKPLLIGILLVGVASVISLVAFGFDAEKFAQWIVLYFQPLAIFVLIRHFSDSDSRVAEYFKTIAYIMVGVAGVLAVIQYFTLYTLPTEWWGNTNEPKRAIAYFAHANAFGLFVTPLLAWLIPDAVKRLQTAWKDFQKGPVSLGIVKDYWINVFSVMAWLLGGVGIFLSLSRGAWFGLAFVVGLYVLLSANKKMLTGFLMAGLVLIGIIAATPNLRYRILLPFHGEKSAVARLSLWDTGYKMILDNPILGKGVNGFSNNWDKYNTDPNLEHYNFPHNIFLNFWVDLGLLGLLGMMMVLANTVWQGLKKSRTNFALASTLFVSAIIVHGLIDIPYLKNDLALVFWMVLALRK